MRLSCLLIGQDNLLIQCGQLLLERNYQISWVISPVPSIQSWCNEHDIPWVSSCQQLPTDKEHRVDYLFSIVNGTILTKEHLKIARCAAINYHDSLLPKYAGVNATTWSILEGESFHGITWHLINEGIDEGDIVYQGQFPISTNETALTLNLRCFEEAVKGFSEILNKIETSTLTPQKQQKEDRSYYGINHVLPNMGFIDWNTFDADSIVRFHRALNFGNYSNNLGLLKIYLNHSFLIVLDVVLAAPSKAQHGGLVLAIEEEGLLISTISQPIFIKKLITIDGKTVTASDLTHIYGIQINTQLPQIEESFLQRNTALYKKALSHEKYWLSELTQIKEHSFFSDRMFDKNNDHKKCPSVDLNKYSINPIQNATVYLLASILVYLYRINNYEPFTVFWHHKTAPQDARLFSNLLPISTNEFQSDFKVSQILELVNHKLELLNKHDTYLSDIFMRQPSLGAIAHDAKKYIITIGLDNNNNELPKNSLIHFSMNQDTDTLTISHRINTHYQGGVLTPVVENMPTHINNILRLMFQEPDTLIHQFSFLSEEERATLITWSVGEYVPLPSNTITDLFEQHVKYSPERPVLYENEAQLSYHQLWIEAEKITAFIQTLNIMPQSLIGISVPPGAKMLALVLGTLKAGCICVPIHPESIKIKNELKCSVLFSIKPYFEQCAREMNQQIYDVDALFSEQPICQNLTLIQPNLSVPKQNCLLLESEQHQVAHLEILNQKQIINYSYWLAHSTHFDNQSILNVTASIPYDLMITSILSSLLAGGRLDFTHADTLLKPEPYLRHLRHRQISHLRITPNEWESLLAYPDEISQLSDLQYVILTDEVSHTDRIVKWRTLNPECRFVVIDSLLT